MKLIQIGPAGKLHDSSICAPGERDFMFSRRSHAMQSEECDGCDTVAAVWVNVISGIYFSDQIGMEDHRTASSPVQQQRRCSALCWMKDE